MISDEEGFHVFLYTLYTNQNIFGQRMGKGKEQGEMQLASHLLFRNLHLSHCFRFRQRQRHTQRQMQSASKTQHMLYFLKSMWFKECK